jgi:hypothetical protein
MRCHFLLCFLMMFLLLEASVLAESNTLLVNFNIGLSNANVVLTDFFASATSVTEGTPMTFSMNLTNTGQLAATNVVVAFTANGPVPVYVSETVDGLAALQSEIVMLVISNASSAAGSYTANALASYVDVNGIVQQSNDRELSYTVVPPATPPGGGGAGGAGTEASMTAISMISIDAAPLFLWANSGTNTTSGIIFKNSGDSVEVVQIKVPKAFSNMVVASSYNLTIDQGRSAQVSLFLNASTSLDPGTYIVPVNLSVKSLQGSVLSSKTEYISFTIYARDFTQPGITNQINVVNNTQSAVGVIRIDSPDNRNMTNVKARIVLPPVVSDVSQIVTSGLLAYVHRVNNTFVIDWDVGYIPQNSSVYGYYTIDKLSYQPLLKFVRTSFIQLANAAPEQILRVTHVDAPIIYADTPANVSIEFLYTGAMPATVSLSLASTSGVSVYPASYTLGVLPNQIISRTFMIYATGTGTQMTELYITSPEGNLTYNIPLVALAASPSSTATNPDSQNQTGGEGLGLSLIADHPFYAMAAATLVAAAAAAMFWINRPQTYSREKSKKLIKLREQIKKGNENG